VAGGAGGSELGGRGGVLAAAVGTEEGQLPPGRGCGDKGLTNLVASLCWVFQKAAMLNGTLSSLAHHSRDVSHGASVQPLTFLSGLHSAADSDCGAETGHSVFAIALTACNSDLALGQEQSHVPISDASTSVPAQLLAKKVDNIQYWLCDSCSEYMKYTKGRLAHVATFQNVVQNLR
jgi:hypothetical protein